jgi:hypothetical protein
MSKDEVSVLVMQEHLHLIGVIKSIVSADTKRGLAKKLGISESMAGLLLKGHRSWTPKYVERLCSEYKIQDSFRKELHRHAARAAGFFMV